MRMRIPVLCMTVVSFALLPRIASAQIVYVDKDATGNNTGVDWANAYTSLQTALQAGWGIEVWVAEGTYCPAPPQGSAAETFTLRNNLGIYGGFSGVETHRAQRDPATHVTILSGDLNGDDLPNWVNMTENTDHIITADGVNSTAVLDGFTIRAGRCTQSSGAGLRIVGASPVISQCKVTGNIADFSPGAGCVIIGGSPRFEACEFTGNYVWLSRGAGAYIAAGSSPTFADCFFSSNTVHGGGAAVADGAGMFIEFDAPTTIERSTFTGNVAEPNYPFYSNGGAICSLGQGLTITQSDFVGNRADTGGALWIGRPARLENTRFTGNKALVGGAIVNFVAAGTLVVGSTFSFNDAEDGGAVSNSTNGVIEFHNSILWGNTGVGETRFKQQVHNAGGTVAFAYSCIEGVFERIPNEDPPNPRSYPGCIDENPMFVDADGSDNRGGTMDDDFRLRPASPCIDAADNARFLPGTQVDLDGSPRFANDLGMPGTGEGGALTADLGCYEFQGRTTGFVLTRPTPGWANASNTWRAGGVAPGRPVYFVYGFDGGSTNVPGCPGVSVTIRQPTIMGSARADGQGEAAITRMVPEAAAGRYIYFQAVDRATCRVSNRILRLF